MKLAVKFSESNQSFAPQFGEVHNISDGGYERGYVAGYEIGNSEGYAKGHAEGAEQGYTKGYKDGVDSVQDYAEMMLSDTLTDYSNEKITSVKLYGFAYCTKLKSVHLPNVTTALAHSFRNCTALKQVYLPKLKKLDTSSFQACTNIETLDFEGLETVGSNSLNGCTTLTSLILRSTTLCNLAYPNAFTNTPIANGTGYIYVPDNLVEQYKTATNWSTYAAQIKTLSELEG